MTVPVHVRKVKEKERLVQQLPGRRLVNVLSPFGREPNALPQRCNLIETKEFWLPGLDSN